MEKVALVTGAGRGIGKAIARELAKDHRIAITWRSSAPDDQLDGMLAINADLSDAAACPDVIQQVIDHYGRLDVIVNNAGALVTSPLDQSETDGLDTNFAVNVIAPHALLTAALPHLKAGASVISISSVNAILPPRGAVMYGASKAALDLWTKGTAKELGPKGIRVNAVAPGAINTPEAPRPDDLTQMFVDLTALGRIGTPEDIAKAVAFLAGDQASFITGEVLTVSGGYRL